MALSPYSPCIHVIVTCDSYMGSDGIKKLYYSIGEVSQQTGLEQHVLRYWETEFEGLSPQKNRAGRRVYTRDDIDFIERLKYLLKDRKFTIEGARNALERQGDTEGGEAVFRKELLALRSFLKEIAEKL